MLKRNLTAIVLIALALLFILYLRTFYVALTDILFGAFMLFGTFEMWQVGKKSGYNAFLFPLIGFAVSFYPLFWFFGAMGILLATMLAFLLAGAVFLFTRDKRKRQIRSAETKMRYSRFSFQLATFQKCQKA